MTATVTKSIFLLPFAMLALAGAAGAVEQRSVLVSYAGLDLSSSAGVATFDQRIRSAVRSVCNYSARDVRAMSERRRCQTEAFAGARAQQQRVIAQAQQQNMVLASR